jgi:hypothetical protein
MAGYSPDPWQAALLRSPDARLLLLCARQTGKSTGAAALTVRTALLRPGSLTLLLSPTLRQSGELFRKALGIYRALGKPVPSVRQTALTLELSNASRIVALPGDEETVRGFSGPSLVILDEAARVRDELYQTVRPMLATSGGALVCLSTPFGQRGWFADAWQGKGSWRRFRITAEECPRIPREFLEEERLALGPRWFRQEYECSFEDAVGAYFDHTSIMGALSGMAPLNLGRVFGE